MRAGRFAGRFWASGGTEFPKVCHSLPCTPMNCRAKYDAASFILGGEIRLPYTHTHTKQTVTDISTPCLLACVDNQWPGVVLLSSTTDSWSGFHHVNSPMPVEWLKDSITVHVCNHWKKNRTTSHLHATADADAVVIAFNEVAILASPSEFLQQVKQDVSNHRFSILNTTNSTTLI